MVEKKVVVGDTVLELEVWDTPSEVYSENMTTLIKTIEPTILLIVYRNDEIDTFYDVVDDSKIDKHIMPLLGKEKAVFLVENAPEDRKS